MSGQECATLNVMQKNERSSTLMQKTKERCAFGTFDILGNIDVHRNLGIFVNKSLKAKIRLQKVIRKAFGMQPIL